ncbi:MAG: endonuclease MutS2 [Desulfomonilaceae bacterium]
MKSWTMREELISDVVSESLASLELPAVLEEVAAHALSAPGRAAVLSAAPESDIDRVKFQLGVVTEFREMIGLHGTLGLADLVPMEGIMERLNSPSAVLDSEEILVVAGLLATVGHVQQRLQALADRFVLLREEAFRITRPILLEDHIRRVFDENGVVRPSASPRLMEIHGRTRAVRERIRKRLEAVVQDEDLARVVQEDYVTLRNDRYVILLRPEFKGLLDGIVHDHSRSGASVYVEPLHVVEFNNQVASLMDEEREEIHRIFLELTEEIRSERDAILEDYKILTWMDAFQSRALYAIATDAVSPMLTQEGFRILGARHPLLLAGEEEEVVPMDVVQQPSTAATVISGANMGGKTVALKIAGLFPLMTRCAILLPAREGTEIQLFTRIMADIGDEQDIKGRISSFSGHMLRIKVIVDSASQGDLVLLDELGGATDPEEGSALAMAIMDELISRGAEVVVTTHLTHLKAYALSRPDVKNVSVEFHPRTLVPTFRLLYDLPGESHAIVTAERIGLAPGVVNAARRYVDKAAGGSSKLIERLREQLSEVEVRRGDLEEKQRTLQAELDTTRSQKEAIVEEFRKEARDLIRHAEKQIADLQQSLKVRKVKIDSNPREELGKIKEEIVAGLGTPLEKPVDLPQVGSRVRVKSLEREGTVKAVLDKGRVEVGIGNLTIRAGAEDLVVRDQGSAKNSSSKKEQIRIDIPPVSPKWELNVIGLRVEDALPIVEKALDEALLGGLPSMNIIHGKGTGRLKKAIWDYLSGHALVQSFRSGDIRAGGAGVTVVDLVSE